MPLRPLGLTLEERRKFLEGELAQHERNLYRLRQQESKYGDGEAPLRISSQTDHEEREIQRVQAGLRQLETG